MKKILWIGGLIYLGGAVWYWTTKTTSSWSLTAKIYQTALWPVYAFVTRG